MRAWCPWARSSCWRCHTPIPAPAWPWPSTRAAAPLPRAVVAPRAESPDAFAARLDPPPDTLVGTGLRAYPEAFDAVEARRRVDAPPAVFPSARVLAMVAGHLDPLGAAAARTLEPDYRRASAARPQRLRDPRVR